MKYPSKLRNAEPGYIAVVWLKPNGKTYCSGFIAPSSWVLVKVAIPIIMENMSGPKVHMIVRIKELKNA